MSRTNDVRRNILIFLALGPVIGGLCMFAQHLASLDYPRALSELSIFGITWMVILYVIGGYVVGALPALATGLVFALVASRRSLNPLESLLLGAVAGLFASALTVVVIALINPGAPKWNWIIPGAGALAGALCGGYCWILERKTRPSSSEELPTRIKQPAA